MIKVLLNVFWVADLDFDVSMRRRLHHRYECEQYAGFKKSPENEQNKGRT